jgi:hypothetical protein
MFSGTFPAKPYFEVAEVERAVVKVSFEEKPAEEPAPSEEKPKAKKKTG